MAPGISSLQLPGPLPSVLAPFSAPTPLAHLGTELGLLLPQTELPAVQGLFPSSGGEYPRAHSHWMGLGHVPIPQPIPGPAGVRQVMGGPVSQVGGLRGPKDLERESLSRGTQTLSQEGDRGTLSRLFRRPHASPLEPLGPWEKSNPVLLSTFRLVVVLCHFTNEQPDA